MIDENSVAPQIIAGAYEDGFSYRATTETANDFLLDKHLPFVSINALRGLIKRINPKLDSVKKGSSDPKCNMDKAQV